MAKDKKAKSESKKAKLAEKKLKQEKKGEKKEKSKRAKANDSDAEDVDLDAVLAEYARQQEQFLKVTEVPCDPPRARGSPTFIASPANTNELFLFGGEFYNGALATFFNDLYIYVIDKDEWRVVTSPNSPLPRSGHAWCRGGNTGGVYLFGGEFSSPKQGTFYHYNDFWRFEPATREWTRIETKGKGPPARSGHRMTYYKKYIILFGGFQDTSQQTKYLHDLWIYDTQNFSWHTPTFPISMQRPDPRSSFTFLPHESGAILFGGYSRVKATVSGKLTKGGGPSQRNVLKPQVHQDCFYLRITPPGADQPAAALPTVRWERRKRPVNAPNPARAGSTMAYHAQARRGIAFGGVHDVEESEEGMDSEFFNTLHAWNIERNRFFQLALRKPRAAKKQTNGNERGGRRGRAQADEEELLRNLAALETGRSLADAHEMELDRPKEEPEPQAPTKTTSMELPHPRFNAQLAVQGDVLYIYGGTFEKGDREFTFDDMYAINLDKLDGSKEIFKREEENWLGEESEDDDEDDEDMEDEDEDEDEELPEADARPFTESKRKKKADEEAEAEVPETPVEDEEDTAPSARDDNLPYPRPFESRRDFFQRTSNEWQNLLIELFQRGASDKAAELDAMPIKEIKAKAFELAEERWWDCREEVMQLEEEQEEAGIGEVVSLADREGGGATARRR